MAVWTTELAPPRPAAGKLAPVSHWRIHIGAHKTATTHLRSAPGVSILATFVGAGGV